MGPLLVVPANPTGENSTSKGSSKTTSFPRVAQVSTGAAHYSGGVDRCEETG